MPALFTKTLTRWSVPRTEARDPSSSSRERGDVTSSSTKLSSLRCRVGIFVASRCAVCSNPCGLATEFSHLRAAAMTWNPPRRTSARASSKPSPRFAPVINVTNRGADMVDYNTASCAGWPHSVLLSAATSRKPRDKEVSSSTLFSSCNNRRLFLKASDT